jgi:hypothetical protein
MSFSNQIRILEAKLKQLERGPFNSENTLRTLSIQEEIKRMKRMEWEENFETVKLEEDR